jgi:hypothetical protein
MEYVDTLIAFDFDFGNANFSLSTDCNLEQYETVQNNCDRQGDAILL